MPKTTIAHPERATRRMDPDTSHEAGESTTDANLSALQNWIVGVLREKPRADHELVAEHLNAVFYEGIRRATAQRIRTARKELVARGLVEWTGAVTQTPYGRKTQTWRVR